MSLSIILARAFLRLPIEFGRWRIERFIFEGARDHPIKRTVTLVGGVRMALDTSDFLQRQLFASGDFDSAVRKAITARLKPGDVFVDIGANVGFYSLCAAKVVGPAGRVFAFEPAPDTMRSLQKNISLNEMENIEAAQIALSNHTGETTLFVDMGQNSGATSMRASSNARHEIKVALDTYDNCAERLGIPKPKLIKIDVEGAETLVLKGMAAVLAQRPTIIIEVSELSLKQMKSSKEELFGIMEAAGYCASLLTVPRQSIYSGSGIFFQYDVIFEPVD